MSNVPVNLETAKNVAQILAVVAGGVWAYYSFVRSRTFKPMLDLSLTGAMHICEGGTADILFTLQIKNIGKARVKIAQEGTALTIWEAVPITAETPTSPAWRQVVVASVFKKHDWIEPGETIRDPQIWKVSLNETTAFKLDLRILCKRTVWPRIEWNDSLIIPTQPDVTKKI